jgi:hypothetical protein
MSDETELYKLTEPGMKMIAEQGEPGQPITGEAEMCLQIGGYSNLLQAKQEAQEFGRPDVFTRRSAIFPNPVDFDLKITPLASTAKEWANPPSPLNQFYVDLHITVSGPVTKIKEWHRRAEAQIQIMHPSYTRKTGHMGERADHLKERFSSMEATKRFPSDKPNPRGEPKVVETPVE